MKISKQTKGQEKPGMNCPITDVVEIFDAFNIHFTGVSVEMNI